VPRYTCTNHKHSRLISDADIIVDLRQIFTAFDSASESSTTASTQACTEVAHGSCDTGTAAVELKDESTLRYGRNVDMMLRSCGFMVERRPSTLQHAGTGVIVTCGNIPAGTVTSLYPGMAALLGDVSMQSMCHLLLPMFQVCLCVSVLDTLVSSTKMAELIEMPLGSSHQ